MVYALENFRLVKHPLDCPKRLRLNRHQSVNLNFKTNPLNCFLHYLECKEGNFLILRLHYSLGHLLNHVFIAQLVAVTNNF